MIDRTVFFEQLNGKRFFCAFSKPETSEKKIVIMSHGFRGTSVGPARQFVDFEQILNKDGFSVLRYDQPNSGNSDGNYLDSSFNEWVETLTYFVKKYLDEGYQIALLGQSMGATTSTIVAAKPELKGKIPCILLWVPGVPDPNHNIDQNVIYEEDGQKYKGSFWIEDREADFMGCLKSYGGGIHLVYGDKDRYIRQELIDEVINIVKEKNQPTMILKGQDHSPWEYEVVQKVYEEEVKKLKEYFV